MVEQTETFLNELHERDASNRNQIEAFVEETTLVFEEAMEGGFDLFSLESETDRESLTFELRDERDIALYELFEIHADGQIDSFFNLETEDYHKELSQMEDELEFYPLEWCETEFDGTERVHIRDIQDRFDAFFEKLSKWMETFFVEVEAIRETDEEVDKIERTLSEEDEDATDSGAQVTEQF